MGWKKFVDWVNLVLGLWLIVAPWIIGGFTALATWATVILGIAIVIVSVAALSKSRSRSPEWINLGLGFLLFLAPWIFKFSGMYRIARNDWTIGIAIAVLAILTFPVHLSRHDATQQPPQVSH